MTASAGREHRTVSRVTTILEAAASSPSGIKLSSLSALLDAPKSSVHGLVKGLLASGYLQEGADGYLLGPAVALLPQPSKPSVLANARKSLSELEERTRETASLSMLVGRSVVYVDMVESRESIRYCAPLQVRRPLYPTSSGKCFLADMSEPQRLAFLGESPGPEIIAELETARRDGVAFNRGETVPDVYAVAAPVRLRGRVIACLSVAGPQHRVEPRLESIAATVIDEARQLSTRSR